VKTGLVMVCDVDLDVADATRTHTVEVARWFAALGLEVDLVTRGPNPELPGVTHHAVGVAASTSGRLRAVNIAAVRLLVRRRKTARRCYVRHEWGQVPVLIAARLLGYRVVTQVDDMQYGRGYEWKLSLALNVARRGAAYAMGKLATGIVAVTPGIRDVLVSDYHVDRRRIEVLPNGVDLALFEPQDRGEALLRSGLDPTQRYVVFTGLFARWVEFDTMLRSFVVIGRARTDVRFVLVGDGPMRSQVEQLIHELGLDGSVLLTGFVRERERVRDYIGAATVCLVAHWAPRLQRIGASPTKVAEYFASGRAVVALALPGVREMVEEASAGFAVANDPAAMADAVGILLDDETKADAAGAAARRAAEEHYSWESVVRRTLPLFGLDAPAA
jgi:glycosyltransferase involved in cell wall biosynthesis